MKKTSQARSQPRQSSRKQNRRRSTPRQTVRLRRTIPTARAVVVGTTEEARPKLVVKRPDSLAEATAEPVIDVAKEKRVSVRRLVRRTA